MDPISNNQISSSSFIYQGWPWNLFTRPPIPLKKNFNFGPQFFLPFFPKTTFFFPPFGKEKCSNPKIYLGNWAPFLSPNFQTFKKVSNFTQGFLIWSLGPYSIIPKLLRHQNFKTYFGDHHNSFKG